MRRLSTILGATVASLFLAGAAKAATFDFDFFAPSVGATQTSVTGNGMFGSNGSSSPFLLTGISGTLFAPNYSSTPFTITGLTAPAAGANDNLLYYGAGAPFVDASGITFTLNNGGGRININYQNGAYTLTALDVGGSGTITTGSVVQTSVLGTPGPVAGVGLVPLFGLAGAYLLGRRRKQLAA